MTATEYVILVDNENHPVGQAEKISAHQQSLLHRAFSVFIFREHHGTELLLQQRAFDKYHSQGLWTNTCCSHPRMGETIIEAGSRRLQEELGISAELRDCGWFHYQTQLENGFSENEIDHVLIGWVGSDILIKPNVDEVHNHRWVPLYLLEKELKDSPEKFTFWFSKALSIAKQHLVKV